MEGEIVKNVFTEAQKRQFLLRAEESRLVQRMKGQLNQALQGVQDTSVEGGTKNEASTSAARNKKMSRQEMQERKTLASLTKEEKVEMHEELRSEMQRSIREGLKDSDERKAQQQQSDRSQHSAEEENRRRRAEQMESERKEQSHQDITNRSNLSKDAVSASVKQEANGNSELSKAVEEVKDVAREGPSELGEKLDSVHMAEQHECAGMNKEKDEKNQESLVSKFLRNMYEYLRRQFGEGGVVGARK